MILYTEKQLQTAYIKYVRELHKYNISSKLYIKIPTLEELDQCMKQKWNYKCKEEIYTNGSSTITR